jgi:ABC-2 type transport system permease protein
MVVLRPVFSYAEVSWTRLVVATFAGALLAAFHAAVAYAVGGWGGSRGRAVGVATIVLVAGYVAALLVPLVDALEWVRVLSPWHWALREQPATNGVHAGGLLLLAGVTALLVWLGTAAVERRDIRPA